MSISHLSKHLFLSSLARSQLTHGLFNIRVPPIREKYLEVFYIFKSEASCQAIFVKTAWRGEIKREGITREAANLRDFSPRVFAQEPPVDSGVFLTFALPSLRPAPARAEACEWLVRQWLRAGDVSL
ncbi:hypothetical protein SBDP1_960006 [Syntrophobacter sp. SbD1]|nr:hypothetical protein SBDP1_960006 [Syntrophobacter sp. SbD1]